MLLTSGNEPSRSVFDPLPRMAVSRFPTKYGLFEAHAFSDRTGTEHLALIYGEPSSHLAPLVRIHSECITGEVFGSARCECGAQLEQALVRFVEEGTGVLVYLRGHEGRGIGLVNKIRAYALQDAGHDTVSANTTLGLPVDARCYQIAVTMLRQLGISRVRLLTNNPEKVSAVEAGGISVESRIPLVVGVSLGNRDYLKTKAEKLGHLIP